MARPLRMKRTDPVGEHGKRRAQVIGGARRQRLDEFELIAANGQQEGLRRASVALAGDGKDGLGTHDVAGKLDGGRWRHVAHRIGRRAGLGGIDEPHDVMRRHVHRVLNIELVVVERRDVGPSQLVDPSRRGRAQPIVLTSGVAVAEDENRAVDRVWAAAQGSEMLIASPWS